MCVHGGSYKLYIIINNMTIRKDTTNKTATRSPLRNRGYERSEHPRINDSTSTDPEWVALCH